MDNALKQPQTIVLLGGRSDIGVAIVKELISASTTKVVLAGRSGAPMPDLGSSHVEIIEVPFDAREPATHEAIVSDVVRRIGDIDVVVMAFGVLGEQDEFDDRPALAADAASVNFGGAMSACLAATKVFRSQGHGQLVVLSSVAGERVRKANFVYGATKAGLDAFAQGLSDALADTPFHVLIVRPGFVHSNMTAGRPAAPFATTPEAVAAATVKALRAGRRIVWAPGILRWVFMVLRHLPTAVWRRLPLG